MTHLETLLSWFMVTFEAVLCGFIFANRAQRVLPFFAAYASTLLVNTSVVWIVYKIFGFGSLVAYLCYWSSLNLNSLMRTLAIAELCRYKLRGYRGIWRLVWRLLAGIAFLLFLHAAFDAWGQPNRLAIYSLTFDRDFDILSVAILGVLLLIHNYYGLSLEPLQRTIAGGICLICGVDAIGDTILRGFYAGYLFPLFSAGSLEASLGLKQNFSRITEAWSTIHLTSFMAAIGVWCFALRKPVPERTDSPSLLPAGVYEELSPAINLRLSAFNNRLLELLKS